MKLICVVLLITGVEIVHSKIGHESDEQLIVRGEEEIPCGPNVTPNSKTCGAISCAKDSSYCCRFRKEIPVQDILNAVLPTIENREYEAMTPLTYSTEFCYGYTPGNPPPKKQLVRGEITNSTFMDYLESKYGTLEHTACVPESYKPGTIIYWVVKILANGQKVRHDSKMYYITKYEIAGCKCLA
ncbi:uncharacterized protein LOC142353375 [Convolutriloba macropyga]|uniref:uncharacterized protein LOC142353375 n=1 Tax=Convolutriloba macropyga TaxID=536237 RepID=UPI003F528EC4